MSADSGDVADSGRRQGARRLVAEKISDTGRPASQPALRSRTPDGDKARGGLWRKKKNRIIGVG